MRFSSLTTVAHCLLLSACTSSMQDPTPGVGSDWANQPWRLHCETENTLALDVKAVPGLYRGRWTYAQDDAGEDLVLQGELEQGFFALHSVINSQGVKFTTNPASLRQACVDTLRREGELEPLALGQVQAARYSGDIDVPILYPDTATFRPSTTRLVVFGDSLSDTGRLKHRMQVFPGEPYWLGRFSNGPVWPDYLEAATALPIQNHAYGGASVARLVALEDAGVIAFVKEGGRYFVSGSLQDQVESYLTVTLEGGTLSAPEDTVFLLWAGANDYVSKEPISGLITTFLNEPDSENGYRAVADETIAELLRQVELLYAAGARHFLLVNLPDLGRTPIVLQNDTYQSVRGRKSNAGRRLELARRLSALSDYHNTELSAAISRLNASLTDIELLLVDSRQMTDAVLEGRLITADETAFDYGFALEAMQRDITHGERHLLVQQQCYFGAYLGSVGNDDTCAHGANVFFWDTIHPATYAHCWQAFQVGQVMADAGWLPAMPSLEEYRTFCRNFPRRDLAPL
jgi:phospholipase/lecithinase/hemolysin